MKMDNGKLKMERETARRKTNGHAELVLDFFHAPKVSPDGLRSVGSISSPSGTSAVQKSAVSASIINRFRNKFGMTNVSKAHDNNIMQSCSHAVLQSKKTAFTLAEVLITLGIIGVVAALTLPALIQHYKKIETASKLKKFYSMMSQAIKMSEIDNNVATSWTKADTQIDTEGNVDGDAQNIIVKEFFMQYLAPYIKYVKFEDGESTVDDSGNKNYNNPVIYFADGSKVTIWNGGCMDFVYDVNGDRNPNIVGRDIYQFSLCCSDTMRQLFMGNKDIVFGPLTVYNGYNWIFQSRANALKACTESAGNCAALIMYDGWEIKDDYPYKL